MSPIIVGNYGDGRDMLFDIFTLGFPSKYWTCTDCANQMFGRFNGMMKNKFMIQMAEVSAFDARNGTDKLKAFITNEKITIKEECKAPYEVRNTARVFATTNTDGAINTGGKKQRRYISQRSSSKYAGDEAYFKPLVDVKTKSRDDWKMCVLSLYHYLATEVECPERFTIDHVEEAETPYMREISEEIASPKDKFLGSLVQEYMEVSNGKIVLKNLQDEESARENYTPWFKASDLFQKFLNFKRINGLLCGEHESSAQLGKWLAGKLHSQDFVIFKKPGGWKSYAFHLPLLKKHYDMVLEHECLVGI